MGRVATRCVLVVIALVAVRPVAMADDFDDAGLRAQIAALYPDPGREGVDATANPSRAELIALGRALFFDPYLSNCGTVACASCHQPSVGWSSPDEIASGCNGRVGRRRAPSIENVAFQRHFFWDGRVSSLEEQAFGPIISTSEMANSWEAVLTYLTSGRHEPTETVHPTRHSAYADSFRRVFQGEITATTVARAIAAFERSLVPGRAPIDRWLAGEDDALEPTQKRGLALFFGRANCSVCHSPPHYTDDRFHNVGVPAAGFETDALFPGNGEIRRIVAANGWRVGDDVDVGRQAAAPFESPELALGAFKTPSLRNVARRARFMHNGVFTTLADVMRHYEATASGDHDPVVGELAFYVRYRKALFGPRGGGEAGDIEAMVALMGAFNAEPHR